MSRLPARVAAVVALSISIVSLAVGPAGAVTPSEGTDDQVTVTQMEKALKHLGLPIAKVDGNLDAYDRRAVCSWRELTGRGASRTVPVPQDERAAMLATEALTPTKTMVVGINVNRECQTATWVVKTNGVRTVKGVFPVSTGMPGHSTPTGTYRINRQINGWHESTKYTGAMMYRPKYFNGGIALHGSITDSYVLPYPASHGCVRMLHRDIDKLWKAGVGPGTPVRVYGDY